MPFCLIGRRVRGWSLALAGCLSIAAGPCWAKDEPKAGPRDQPQEATEAELTRLIQQLGAEDFARREKAEEELRNVGLLAFDALHKAQYHDDIEIAFRARHLLRSMAIRWFRDEDSAEVKELLRGYQDKAPEERRNLMDQLSKLHDSLGVAALCRLARFDPSNVLSKRAALLVLRLQPAADPLASQALADSVHREIGLSRREAADWLRTYVTTLSNPEGSLAAWERICREEDELFQRTPEKTSQDIVRDLLRWQVELLGHLQRHERADAVVTKTIDLLDGSREQLVEMAGWLSERKAWATLEQLAKRFPERFNENVSLLYPLAEAQLQQGRKEVAEETAQRALKANADAPKEHNEAAYQLQERGLFAWAEREYRHVMELGPLGSIHEVQARFLLSEMLHDQQRELDAAKALQPVIEALDRDQALLHVVARLRQPDSVRSRMHFFLAEHAKSTGNAAQQIQHLRDAVKQDPTDADVLIAMHRAPAPDDQWRQDTSNLLRQAAKSFREKIRDCEQQANEAPIEEGRALYQRQLALELNQFAWLIANTEGDYDEALRCSQRSLELLPENAGYLDTLARCHFAKQDYENAVKLQSRALKLEPHSGQMQRQLKLFQQAQEGSRR